MTKLVRVALIGWDNKARCILDAWAGGEAHAKIMAVIRPEGGASGMPVDLNLPLIDRASRLGEAGPVDVLLDLRAPGSARPEGLPDDVTWIPPDATRLLVDLCVQRDELARYRGVVETARDAVVTIDESHRIVFFNRAAETMFGYDRRDMVGSDLSILIPPPHKEKHREYVRRYVETRRGKFIDHTVELTAQRRSGEPFPIRISFSVAEEGGHLLMTGMIRDISELKRLEKRAIQSERLASIGQALSYVTHEIKNPLLVIGGFARSLQRSEAIPEEDRKRLEIIVSEVQRLEGLLAEIQDFNKPLTLEKEPLEIAPFLKEILTLFEDIEAARKVSFPLDVRGSPVVLADPDRLRQVMINLVKNALEAIEDRGRVLVEAAEEDGSVVIQIRDTGVGIDPDRIEELFEPFVTTKKAGTGLGLPLCRKIIREHGGELTLQSEKGKGTRARVVLPAGP